MNDILTLQHQRIISMISVTIELGKTERALLENLVFNDFGLLRLLLLEKNY